MKTVGVEMSASLVLEARVFVLLRKAPFQLAGVKTNLLARW
jgi:hypothetical protein